MNRKFQRAFGLLPFVMLGAGFLAFGLFLRSRLPWDDLLELHGLDYGIHGFKFADFHWIGEMSFRHPLLGLFTAPITLFGHRLHMVGPWPYWSFLLMVFAVTMTAAAILVHSILKASGAGRGPAAVGTMLFASFSYTWILAACPESFAFACLGLLLVIRWGVSKPSTSSPYARWIWLGFAVLNGGITLTHGPKVILAYLASKGITFRRIIRILVLLAGVAALFLLTMAMRNLIFNLTHAEAKANFSDGLVKSCISFTTGVDLNTRIKLIAGFFSEPIITHNDAWGVNHLERPYQNWIAPCAITMLYAAAIAGALMGRRSPMVKILLAMFSIDLVLHVICFWGMAEGHIYCGHWLFTPALLAAQLPASLTGHRRQVTLMLLSALSLVIFLNSVYNLLN